MRQLIGIFGAGEGATPGDLVHARRLGELAAGCGWVVLTGGRNAGVMAAATAGAREAGGLTVGILPSSTSEGCAELDIAIVTGMGSARNNINVLSSSVIVAVGRGGPGTVSEVALALKSGRPLILLGAPPETVAFFGHLGAGELITVETPEEAVAAAGQLLRVG
jgi:uncharacterized protein (TIGR00725 family)